MTLEQLKAAIADLPAADQNKLAAFLTHLRHRRDPSWPEESARKIDDRNPANWVAWRNFDEDGGK